MSSTCLGLFEYAGVEFNPLVLMVIVNTLLTLSLLHVSGRLHLEISNVKGWEVICGSPNLYTRL